ncbi:signal transduction histidine kinase [Dyadobacter jejuensis]|uniref:histidine kinase n=1 Tax=Dyadobacter jejuensis TaxID=1082580 RepID=A0A316AGQ7_9BACT|nr:tetratricopeptide repeat-containing sensor histidine kinase [Dyadobacter jejuensis]PWJ56976.1 signal transduction histidine kinase [Dyadobacter jejuensis]
MYHYLLKYVFPGPWTGVIGLACLYWAVLGCTPQKEEKHLATDFSIQVLVDSAFNSGKPKEALAVYDSVYAELDSPSLEDRLDRYIFLGAEYYRRTGEFLKALESLDSALYLLDSETLRMRYRSRYIAVNFAKGDRLLDMGKYPESYESFYEAMEAAKKDANPCALSDYNYRLGMVSYRQEKYEDAITHFSASLVGQDFCGTTFAEFAKKQELMNNIAISFGKLKQLDSALVYSNRALDYIEREGPKYPYKKVYNHSAQAVIYGNQSDYYAQLGRYAKAESLLLKSIVINSQPGYDKADGYISLLKLGMLYQQTRQPAKTYEVLKRLDASPGLMEIPQAEEKLYKLKSDYFFSVKKMDSAYVYLKRYQSVLTASDSLAHKLILADLDEEFRILRQKQENRELVQAIELKKIWLYLSFAMLAMTLAILLLLWRHWRLSTNNLRSLENLNKQITVQNMKYEQTLADLNRSSKEKDRILKVVAHDLRSPIGAIASISSILLDEVNFNKDQRKLVTMIKELTWQSMDMVRDVLGNRNGQKGQDLKTEKMDLRELAFACVRQITFKAEAKKQRLFLHAEEDIFMEGDKEKLGRVLINILINAIKFSPVGKDIHVFLVLEGSEVVIKIQDEGIGIPKELHEQVFVDNGSAKRTGTNGEKSYGIGLPFSKNVVEGHQGKIWFESEEEHGTTFYISLPLQQSATTHSAKEPSTV